MIQLDAMKANEKLPMLSIARLYNTWPNVKEHRPLVYAVCTDCWDEKLFADTEVLVAEAGRQLGDGPCLQCSDCNEAEQKAILWSVLFRC